MVQKLVSLEAVVARSMRFWPLVFLGVVLGGFSMPSAGSGFILDQLHLPTMPTSYSYACDVTSGAVRLSDPRSRGAQSGPNYDYDAARLSVPGNPSIHPRCLDVDPVNPTDPSGRVTQQEALVTGLKSEQPRG